MNQLKTILCSYFVALFLISNSVASNPIDNSMVLSNTEINTKIQSLPQWTIDGKTITRTFKFQDFVTAIDFVNQLVEPAESAGHHPDLEISYNKVKVILTTHDAGGLTEMDFSLAEQISQIAK